MSKAAAPPRSAPRPGKEKGGRNRTKMSGSVKSSGQSRTLRAKEEEYMRMNAALEAKTAELVKEAEHLVKGNISLLSDLESSVEESKSSTKQSSVDNPPVTFVTSAPRPPSSSLPSNSTQPSLLTTKPRKHSSRLSNEVTTTTDRSAATDLNSIVQRMEQELEGVEWNDDRTDEILPEAAEDMGPEAVTRFLKAKLRVMQEEIDRLCQELTIKDKKLSQREAEVKQITEHNNKLLKTHRTLQPELEKQKSMTEGLRQKCTGLETQLTNLRKEVEVMKGGERKAKSRHGAVEVRLNRALEEVEKYKSEIAILRAYNEDIGRNEKGKLETLTTENKQLLRQRNELMTAFKKQLKLIDILKKQKMHIEAAKLLSFTEDEFVKALDWQHTS